MLKSLNANQITDGHRRPSHSSDRQMNQIELIASGKYRQPMLRAGQFRPTNAKLPAKLWRLRACRCGGTGASTVQSCSAQAMSTMQPHSTANQAVFLALLQPNDRIIRRTTHGEHLTSSPVTCRASGSMWSL
jgi:hypothetical protein